MATLMIPDALRTSCRQSRERMAWLDSLNDVITSLQSRWSLRLGAPFDRDVSCAWVAPGVRHGAPIVLKIGMPHMEGEDEIAGLRFWNGDPTVHLFDADDALNAMLLERCMPGDSLRALPESEQDGIIAGLLRRLWSHRGNTPFRPLQALTAFWTEETMGRESDWADPPLVREGLALMRQLASDAPSTVPLATDLHAGNVLSAQRERWLAIDPKPFVGDPAFDATQHLLNCRTRLLTDTIETVNRFSDLAGVDASRVRQWLFARGAAEPRPDWSASSMRLARVLGRGG